MRKKKTKNSALLYYPIRVRPERQPHRDDGRDREAHSLPLQQPEPAGGNHGQRKEPCKVQLQRRRHDKTTRSGEQPCDRVRL